MTQLRRWKCFAGSVNLSGSSSQLARLFRWSFSGKKLATNRILIVAFQWVFPVWYWQSFSGLSGLGKKTSQNWVHSIINVSSWSGWICRFLRSFFGGDYLSKFMKLERWFLPIQCFGKFGFSWELELCHLVLVYYHPIDLGIWSFAFFLSGHARLKCSFAW